MTTLHLSVSAHSIHRSRSFRTDTFPVDAQGSVAPNHLKAFSPPLVCIWSNCFDLATRIFVC